MSPRKAIFITTGIVLAFFASIVPASTDWKVNQDTDGSVQNESFICVNPYYSGDPMNVVVTYNDIGKTLGASWSPDSGKTFTDVQLPYVWSTTGDPSIACDVSGNLYACFLSYEGTWFYGSSGIFVSKSIDGGRTWMTPVKADSLKWAGGAAVPFADKCFLAVDTNVLSPYLNNIYVGWQRDDTLGSNSDIYFARSVDGGASFSTPMKINDNSPQTAYAEGAFPFVAADGKVFMTWYDCYFKGGVPGSLYVDISYDGGATFGTDMKVANFDAPAKYTYAGTGFKAKCFPAAAADPIDANKAYITYMADPDGYADIRLDGGDDAGLTHSDNVVLSRSGTDVYAAWQDHRAGGLADVYFNHSPDDGKTWQIIATGPLDNTDTPGANASINIKLSSSGNNVYCVWEDWRSTYGNADVYFNYSTNNGQTWATEQHIDGHVSASSSGPEIASVGSYVYVVWMDTRSLSGGDIYFNRSTNGGLSWGTVYRLDPGNTVSHTPKICAQGSDVYVIWMDDHYGTMEPLFQHSANNGSTWQTAPTRLASAPGPIVATPEIACSGNYVYTCWNDDRNGTLEIFFNQSPNNGVNWSGDIAINDPPTMIWQATNPQIHASGNYVYITWVDTRMTSGMGGMDIFFDYSPDNGVTWQSPDIGPIDAGAVGLSSGPMFLESDGTNVYLTWLDSRMGPGNFQVFFSRSTNNGATWGPDIHINQGTLPFGLSFAFPVISAGNGHVNVAWPDPRYVYMAMGQQDIMLNYSTDYGATWLVGPDEADVFCINTQDGGATWSSPVTVNDDATNWAQNLPWVAVRTDGLVDIAYYNFRPTPLDPMIPGAEVRMAISADFGSTFMSSFLIQDTVVTPRTQWVGEYIGIGLMDTIALTVFTDFEQSGGNSDIYIDWSSFVMAGDSDGDGVPDGSDNCPAVHNPGQANNDADSHGDACDNCDFTDNESQINSDADSLGDACDNCDYVDNDSQTNSDADTIGDACDNCAFVTNENQANSDTDSHGDACDNCATTDNESQLNSDSDSYGDACDNCPAVDNESQTNSDGDSHGDACDNCVTTDNESQLNSDSDSFGDACDNCPAVDNEPQTNSDGDSHGDACDNCVTTDNESQTNSDGDSFGDACDNCPLVDNEDQANMDGDALGDVCDPDKDGDGIDEDGDGNGIPGDNPCTGGATTGCDDNCPNHANSDQADDDSDGIGNVCDGIGCCGIYTGGLSGNANCSTDGKLTLSDISRMIDYLYISKADLCCYATGNTNGSTDCKITLSDISRLIDVLYISKNPPEACMPSCEQ